MKHRKSPILHHVRKHTRKGKTVSLYWRGKGSKNFRPANPTPKQPKLKHYVVRYEVLQDGIWRRDSTNCFVGNKKNILQDLQKDFIGKPPKIRITKIELQTPSKPILKPLLDVDTRTRSRMERGYVLGNIKISQIDLPPAEFKGRYKDNYEKIKKTKSVPPVHLTPLPNGRYAIEDGRHRIHAAKDLGYDEIPALFKYGVD